MLKITLYLYLNKEITQLKNELKAQDNYKTKYEKLLEESKQLKNNLKKVIHINNFLKAI